MPPQTIKTSGITRKHLNGCLRICAVSRKHRGNYSVLRAPSPTTRC
jgi:hypothetical protein